MRSLLYVHRSLVDELLRKKEADLADEQHKEKLSNFIQSLLNAGKGYAVEALCVPGINTPEDSPRTEIMTDGNISVLKSLLKMAHRCMEKDSPYADEALGSDLLSRLGRITSRTNAFKLCIQLGLLDEHVNLFVQGTVFESDFTENAIQVQFGS